MEVELPDGTIVEFPEGTPPETIKAVLSKRFGKVPSGEAPQYAANGVPMNDAAKREIRDKAKAGTLTVSPENAGNAAYATSMAETRANQGPFAAFAGNLAPGVTFGFADEIGAGISAMTGGDYDQTLESLRAIQDNQAEDNPKSAVAGQIVGAVGVPVGTFARGGSLLRNVAQNALTGMGLAGLYGFGTGEGGFENRATNALNAAPLGFALGGAAPLAASALTGVVGGGFNALRGVVDRVRGTGNEKAANRAIARVIEKSGRSPDDIAASVRQAATEGQPEFRLMDATGQAGQRMASTVVRRGDDGAESLANFLRQRQTDQSTRVPRFVEDAFGAKKSAAKTEVAMNVARKEANRVNYAAASEGAGPVNLSSAVDTIDDLLRRNPIVGEAAFGRSEIGNRLAALRGQLASDKGMRTDFRAVLEIKEDLGRVIGGIKRTGGEVPPQLASVYGELDSALEAASPAYRAANDTARTARQNIAAIEEGADMSRPGARFQDTTSRFAAMTADQQSAARVGYADRILAQIEANKAITANRAAPFNSTKAAEEARAMTLNPDVFARQIGRENDMWGTMNRALGGSRTADNLMDDAMAIPTEGPGRQAIVDALRLNFGGAATNLAIAVAPALRGQSPATRKMIADALMSQDPAVALRAAAQSVKDEGVKRAIEAALMKSAAVTVAD